MLSDLGTVKVSDPVEIVGLMDKPRNTVALCLSVNFALYILKYVVSVSQLRIFISPWQTERLSLCGNTPSLIISTLYLKVSFVLLDIVYHLILICELYYSYQST